MEIFEDDQLTDLYRVCSLYHRMLYDFLLMTGFREQEAMYITWENVLFGANIVEMRWKTQFHWSPKAYKEREVPVPDELLEALEIYRKSLPAKRAAPGALVFSTRSGRPDTHMIRALKRNARESRVESGRFLASQVPGDVRTTDLCAGVDLKTVMAWMGQTTMDSIIRYLKPARRDEVIHKVNSSFTGPTFANRKEISGQSLTAGDIYHSPATGRGAAMSLVLTPKRNLRRFSLVRPAGRTRLGGVSPLHTRQGEVLADHGHAGGACDGAACKTGGVVAEEQSRPHPAFAESLQKGTPAPASLQ